MDAWFQWLRLGRASKSGSASGQDSFTYPRSAALSQFTITFGAGFLVAITTKLEHGLGATLAWKPRFEED